jgi:branched-chain amino acid transport system permease protein
MELHFFSKTFKFNYFLVFILIFFSLLVIPIVVRHSYVSLILTTAFIQSIYAMAWNLLAKSGQGSLGHAGFLGIGAYASALIARNLGLSPIFSIFIGPLFAAMVGLGVGLLCVRLKEWFLAMVTFGFALIVETLVVDQLSWLTNGWDGFTVPSLLPYSITFGGLSFYYIAFGSMLIIYFLTRKIFQSPFGLGLSAIHDNQLLASVSGISLVKHKLLAFVASSYIAGFAGALDAHTVGRFISPEIFTPLNSFWPLVYSVGGGIGSAEGPVIGAVLIRLFWEWLRTLGGYESMIIIGIVLVLEVILLPGGLVSLLTGKSRFSLKK